MLWASCHAKTFNSEGAVDDKKVGAGEKTGKIYGKLATPLFYQELLHYAPLLFALVFTLCAGCGGEAG